MARQVFDTHGWHTEIYVDGGQLADLEAALRRLPRICVDHLGLSAEGLPTLRRLLQAGAYVKATGFGRVHLDVASSLRTLVEANPSAVVFGTDLPSTRARRPFRDSDVNLVVDAVGEEVANAILADNAVALYRMPPVRSQPAHLEQ